MKFLADFYPDCTTKLTAIDPETDGCDVAMQAAATAAEAVISAIVVGVTTFASVQSAVQTIINNYNTANPSCYLARVEVVNAEGSSAYLKITSDYHDGVNRFWMYSFELSSGVVDSFSFDTFGGFGDLPIECQEVSPLEVELLNQLLAGEQPDTIFWDITYSQNTIQALPKISSLNQILLTFDDIGQLVSEVSFRKVPTIYENPFITSIAGFKAKSRNGQTIYPLNDVQIGIWQPGKLTPDILQTIIDPENETLIDACLIGNKPITGREVKQSSFLSSINDFSLVWLQTVNTDNVALFIDGQRFGLTGSITISDWSRTLQPLGGFRFAYIIYNVTTPGTLSSGAAILNGKNSEGTLDVVQVLDQLLAVYPVGFGKAFMFVKRNGTSDIRLAYFFKPGSSPNTLTDLPFTAFTSLTSHVQDAVGIIAFVGSNLGLVCFARRIDDSTFLTAESDVSANFDVLALQLLDDKIIAIARLTSGEIASYQVDYSDDLNTISFTRLLTYQNGAGGQDLTVQPTAIGLHDLSNLWVIDDNLIAAQSVSVAGKKLCRSCRTWDCLDGGDFPSQPPLLVGIGYWVIQDTFIVT
jgi:hypothetical protein